MMKANHIVEQESVACNREDDFLAQMHRSVK